ncbi:MAG: cyclase family protein [Chloroflexi bacterium]|nr:cyclase family protein [Chloroflexota bacterium]
MTQDKIGNWGRWGDDDERGAANFITPEVLKSALGVVKKGKVYSLCLPLQLQFDGVTFAPFANRVGSVHLMSLDGGDFAAGRTPRDGRKSADDYLFLFLHGSTHIDALSHVWIDDKIYGGFSGDTVTSTGAEYCGIDKLKWIVGRGVLLDIARYKGVDVLGKSYAITPADLDGCAEQQGVDIRSGDILLIRTGCINALKTDAGAWVSKQPGIGIDTVPWIAEREVCAVGADNTTLEVQPIKKSVHVELLRNRGVYVMEMLSLDELAADKAYEFLFVAAPLRIGRATASPLNPLAIV